MPDVPDLNALPATWLDVRQLVPWESNPKLHPRRQLDEIKRSIRKLGWGDPMVAQLGTNRLVSGHGRRLALLEILEQDPEFTVRGCPGPGIVPVRLVDAPWEALTELALAANRTGELGAWEDEALGRVLRSLGAEHDATRAALATGWSDDELAGLLRRDARRARRDAMPPEAPEVPDVPVSVPGVVYRLGPHRVLCGDSTDPATLPHLLAEVPDGRGKVDLVFTDPPYAIYGSATGLTSSVTDDSIVRPFFRAVLVVAEQALDLFGCAYVCCDWRSWPSWWEVAKGLHIEPKNLIVWNKNSSGLGSNWANTYELIGYFVKVPEQTAMKSTTKATGIRPVLSPNVITADRVKGAERLHNAAKPVAVIERVITVTGDHVAHVLDPFLGSGSTLIAAARCGRSCYGIDKDPKWVDVTRRRWHRWATEAGIDPGPDALPSLEVSP